MNKQFDPSSQFDQLAAELDIKIADILTGLDRVKWLRGRIAEQIADLTAERDALEIYTEAEAATLLRLDRPQHLANLRGHYDLPHMKVGNSVRYTKQQIAEICERLTINSSRESVVSSRQRRKAA